MIKMRTNKEINKFLNHKYLQIKIIKKKKDFNSKNN